MTWIYLDKPFIEIPDGIIAFVYEITNKVDGRKYVGKKLFKFTRLSKRKGKRVKRRVVSDWEQYFGSCKELLSDVEKLGRENFARKILYLCRSKGEASYLEAKEQFARDVLLSDNYYNAYIGCRINKRHLMR